MVVMLKEEKYFYVMKIVFVLLVLLWNGHIKVLADQGEMITSVIIPHVSLNSQGKRI